MTENNEKEKIRIRKQSLFLMPVIMIANAGFFCFMGYLLVVVFGIPGRLDMPLAIRVLGIVVMVLGFFFVGWMFRYRKISDFLNSTYLSIKKNFTWTPLNDASNRIEPLILQGPQTHVRHPTYFSVVSVVLGLWLVLDYTFLLIMALLLLGWFYFVIIYNEEKELKALFKEEYEAYASCVPKFIPSWKSRWP